MYLLTLVNRQVLRQKLFSILLQKHNTKPTLHLQTILFNGLYISRNFRKKAILSKGSFWQ